MINVVPLKPEHLIRFELQEDQQYFADLIADPHGYIRMVTENGHAYAVVCDGETLCVAGLIEIWPERSLLWSLISKNAGPHMLYITRAGRRLVETLGTKRVEATVDCDFEQGHRFIRMLGFELEAERMRSYEPDGRDCALYARIF